MNTGNYSFALFARDVQQMADKGLARPGERIFAYCFPDSAAMRKEVVQFAIDTGIATVSEMIMGNTGTSAPALEQGKRAGAVDMQEFPPVALVVIGTDEMYVTALARLGQPAHNTFLWPA